MSHTTVKTTYSRMGTYGSTDTVTLYCHHNHSADYTVFYDERGVVQDMIFNEWDSGNDLWDAMERLYSPFKDEWNSELKEGVEYYSQSEMDELYEKLRKPDNTSK